MSNLKRFEQIELPAKLLDYVVWSNKSNINQTQGYYCRLAKGCWGWVFAGDAVMMDLNSSKTKSTTSLDNITTQP